MCVRLLLMPITADSLQLSRAESNFFVKVNIWLALYSDLWILFGRATLLPASCTLCRIRVSSFLYFRFALHGNLVLLVIHFIPFHVFTLVLFLLHVLSSLLFIFQ